MNTAKIMRSDDLRAENRHRILQTLRKHGPLSRAEIGKQTGLSQAALSSQFGLMIEEGIVTSQSNNTDDQKRGRPKTTVALAPDAAIVVTAALTIDQLRVCVVNYAGETLCESEDQLDTRALSARQILNTIAKAIKISIKPYEVERLKAISIGFQGVTDAASGQLVWSPILSVEKVPVASHLTKQFKVPVTVNNDSGLIAKALHIREYKTLGDNFAAVLFSYGIGLGLYIAGQPFTGAHSSGLELGHLQFEKDGALCRCGKRGCIEAYAGKYGILRTANKLSDARVSSVQVSTETIDQLAAVAQHKPAEKIAFEMAGKAIGFGLATLFTLLDPLPIALIGHSKKTVDLMRSDIENELKTQARSRNDPIPALYCFHEDAALLFDGLVLESMAVVDRLFADKVEDALTESA